MPKNPNAPNLDELEPGTDIRRPIERTWLAPTVAIYDNHGGCINLVVRNSGSAQHGTPHERLELVLTLPHAQALARELVSQIGYAWQDLVAQLATAPCDTCASTRLVEQVGPGGRPERVRCPDCGPRLASEARAKAVAAVAPPGPYRERLAATIASGYGWE